MFEITIVAIMKLCSFNSIGSWRQTICKYTIFMKKNKKQHKHSKCLNMLKLKHDIKLLVYEHYQVKDMKLKHNIKLLVYEHYQVKDMKL
jgi:hypothetical protein